MSEPTRRGRSKKRPGIDAQRRAVVDVAVRLFTEQGTGGVSISQLCTAADISRPTFYRCFPDKDALVAHIYDLAVRDHVQVNLASVLQEGSRPEAVRAALGVMIDRILERPRIAAFLFGESSDPRSPAHAIIQGSFDAAAREIRAWYAARGLSAPPEITLKATMVACQWIVHDTIRRGLTPAARAGAREAMWALVEGIFFHQPPATPQ